MQPNASEWLNLRSRSDSDQPMFAHHLSTPPSFMNLTLFDWSTTIKQIAGARSLCRERERERGKSTRNQDCSSVLLPQELDVTCFHQVMHLGATEEMPEP